MRVLLCTNGTHGDVNPFLGLGRELRRRGHAVTVFVNSYFESDVTAAGLEFLAQGEYIDIPSFIREHKIMEERGGARRMVRKVFRETPGTIPVLRRRCDGAECPDAVVAHTMCMSPEWICRERSIPHVSLAITPLNWWSRHDPIPAIQRERGAIHRIVCRLLDPAIRSLVRRGAARKCDEIQRNAGMEPPPGSHRTGWYGIDLTLGMWSPHVRAEMPDDPPNAAICGFSWFDGVATWEPDPDLERFLADGEPPIVFSLGTSAVHVPGKFYAVAVEVCRQLGRRGVLLCGAADAGPENLGEDVRAFGYAPFSRVLPRGCASVIHGGVGSMAQALRAGRPTVIVPFAFDQFNNALRVERLGLGAMVRREEAGTEALASTLRRLLDDPAMASRCHEMGARLSEEDGAVVAADRLEQLGSV